MKSLFLAITIIIILILTPFLLWTYTDESTFHVAIIDKTVADTTYREHKGLIWLLNHEKLVKPHSNEMYDVSTDYFGFFPLEDKEYRIHELPDDLEALDLIYIADTYGVFHDDYYEEDGNISGTRSKKVYGGITVEEIDTITKYLYEEQTTLIAEFNSFASPTSNEARTKLTNLLSLEWTGWIGRYFSELNPTKTDEVPIWAIEQYEAQHNKEWDFSRGGFILVNENDTIVVLEDAIHLDQNGIHVTFTEQGQTFFELRDSPRYDYWFDIVVPREEEDILANYHWDLTAEGISHLMQYGVPTSFPAIMSSDRLGFTSYYFAGDYADGESIPSFYRIKGYPGFKKHFSASQAGSLEAFYWKTYVPMMQKILEIEKNKTVN